MANRHCWFKFDFATKIDKLNEENRLYQMVQHFAKAPLDPKTVDNHFMGTIYEELIRKSSEASNEAAGAHFTPREVIKLMVDLLFSPDKEILKQKNLVRSVYDPAAGTGGMLSIASEYVRELNPDLQIDIFGQETQPETYAICKSDTVLKGLDPDKIKRGNSLISSDEDKAILGDGFPDQKFYYMLSNPPFGENWEAYYPEIKIEADKYH
jgi:type I restriction enzyme M protein